MIAILSCADLKSLGLMGKEIATTVIRVIRNHDPTLKEQGREENIDERIAEEEILKN